MAVFSILAELPKQQTTPPYSWSISTISRVAMTTHTHTSSTTTVHAHTDAAVLTLLLLPSCTELANFLCSTQINWISKKLQESFMLQCFAAVGKAVGL